MCARVQPIRCRGKGSCGGVDVSLVEFWRNHTISWRAGDAADAGVLSGGEPRYVMGRCACGHEWRLAKQTQMTPELHAQLHESARLLAVQRATTDARRIKSEAATTRRQVRKYRAMNMSDREISAALDIPESEIPLYL